ncbi:MAG: penicillin-binding protein activator [Candidatus Schekmanbacteria bacterium]|nr:penicillin-binding protein activator [Candidatus Schekmanbacteria bacterium]
MLKSIKCKIICFLPGLLFLANLTCLNTAYAAPFPNGVSKTQAKPPNKKPEETEYQAALTLYNDQNYAQAIDRLRLFLHKYPESHYLDYAQLMLAESFYQTAAYHEALNLYHQLAAKNPSMLTDEIRWKTAESDFAVGNHQPALDTYQQLLATDSHSVDRERLLYKTVLAAFNLGEIVVAQDSLLQMNGQSLTLEEKVNLLLTQSQIARKMEAYRPAWQSALQAMQASGQNAFPEAFKYRTQAKSLLGELITDFLPKAELELMLPEVPHEFPGGEILRHLAQEELKADNAPEALKYLDRFITDFPPNYPQYSDALTLHQRLSGQTFPDNFRLGVIVPLSGKIANLGQAVWRGVRLAVDEYNQDAEQPVVLVLRDSQANINLASQGFLDIAGQNKLLAVIGPVMNTEAAALAKIANDRGIPLINPAAAGEGIPQSGPYVFHNSLTVAQQVESIVHFAVERMGLRSFVVFHSTNPYSLELAKNFMAEVEKYGLSRPKQITYAPQETDFRQKIETIYKLLPEALFLPDFSEKIVLFAPQLAFYAPETENVNTNQAVLPPPFPSSKEAETSDDLLPWQAAEKFYLSTQEKLNLRLAPVEEEQNFHAPNPLTGFFLLGINGWYNPQLLKEGDRTLERAVFPCGFFSRSSDPLIVAFVQGFRKRFGPEPDLLAAQAYDSARIFLQAMREGATTRQKIQETLANLHKFPGVTGLTSFNRNGDVQKEPALVSIKSRKFIQLTGQETQPLVLHNPVWYPLLKADHLDELLPEELFYLLAP